MPIPGPPPTGQLSEADHGRCQAGPETQLSSMSRDTTPCRCRRRLKGRSRMSVAALPMTSPSGILSCADPPGSAMGFARRWPSVIARTGTTNRPRVGPCLAQRASAPRPRELAMSHEDVGIGAASSRFGLAVPPPGDIESLWTRIQGGLRGETPSSPFLPRLRRSAWPRAAGDLPGVRAATARDACRGPGRTPPVCHPRRIGSKRSAPWRDPLGAEVTTLTHSPSINAHSES
jgi:hypothetical protein